MKQLIKKLINIPSIYPDEQKITQYLKEYLETAGLTVKADTVSKGRSNLLISKSSKTAKILFLGHVDTVHPTNRTAWNTDPFKASIMGDQLYGLGSYDMKGGIVAMIKAITSSDSPAKMLLTIDEENISAGSWHVVENNGNFFDGVELVISAEPNFGKGENTVTVGRTGRCVFTAEAVGKEAHISQYKKGRDAINMMANFCVKVYQQRDQLERKTGSVVQIRQIGGNANGMSVCGVAQAEIEVLLSPQSSVVSILKWLKQLDSKIKLAPKVRQTPYLEGYENRDFPFKDQVDRTIKQIVGKSASYVTRQSVADDNVVASIGLPVITWGPTGDNAHAPNEWVSLRSLETLSRLYQVVLRNAA